MTKPYYEKREITDFKDLINQSTAIYGNKDAFSIKGIMGEYTGITYKELKKDIDAVGTEFVNPKGQRDLQGSLPASGEIAAKVQKMCFENYLVAEKGGRDGSVMRCLCALNISEEDVNKALDIFEKCVLEIDKEYK